MKNDNDTYSATSIPSIPDESVGSSVSSRLQEEYESILKYAMVTPAAGGGFHNRLGDDQELSEDQIRLLRISNPNPTPFRPPDKKLSSASTSTESVKSCDSTTGSEPVKLTKSREDVTSKVQHGSLSGLTGSMNTTEGEKERENEIRHQVFGSLHHNPTEHYSSNTLDELDDIVESETLPKRPAEPEDESLQNVHDSDIVRLESQLDDWNLSLRQNILAELTQIKLKLLQQQRNRIIDEREKSNQRMAKLTCQNEELKELVANCERNLAQKDAIITNLTTSLNKQKAKEGLMKSFHSWKLRHCDEKREEFACQIASEYYTRRLVWRAFRAWQSVQENKWKERVERACQNRAQEVCEQLTRDYEEKIAQFQRQLGHAHAEIATMRADRDQFEERMKKGFMRGVCALNLEAMTMFKEDEGTKENIEPTQDIPIMQSIPVQSEHPLPNMTTTTYNHLTNPLTSKRQQSVVVKMVANSNLSNKPPVFKPKLNNQVTVERHTGSTQHLPVRVPPRKPKHKHSVKIVE